MVATTQTDICNRAIDQIGGKPITSITSGTPSANACLRAWATALKATLSEHKWPFAKVVETLTLVATYTPLEWVYAYAYPSNCVRLWLVYNEGTSDKTIGEKFTEEYDKINAQRVILTDVETAYGEYTYYVTDPSLFDHIFTQAIIHRLAAEIAVPITGDENKAKNQTILFNGVVGEAKRLAAHGHNPNTNPPNRFADSRA
jgi:hypothetical protein